MTVKKRWKLDKDLRRALDQRNLVAAREAIEKGADPNHILELADKIYTRPLVLAAAMEEPTLVSLLLELGADPELRDKDGMSPAHASADPITMQILLAAGVSATACTTSGETPLHLTRDRQSAQLLIAAGAEIGALCSQGLRPFETTSQKLEAIRSHLPAAAELIVNWEDAIAFLESLENAGTLESITPQVGMTAAQETAKAKDGRF